MDQYRYHPTRVSDCLSLDNMEIRRCTYLETAIVICTIIPRGTLWVDNHLIGVELRISEQIQVNLVLGISGSAMVRHNERSRIVYRVLRWDKDNVSSLTDRSVVEAARFLLSWKLRPTATRLAVDSSHEGSKTEKRVEQPLE
jgi:hypothetical protein